MGLTLVTIKGADGVSYDVVLDSVTNQLYPINKIGFGAEGESPTIVSSADPLPVGLGDSPSRDSFARMRTSDPHTLFDNKQLADNQPLFWDDAQTSGSGTSSAHSANEAASTISVGATTAGVRVRQTFQRFNYQPGKSQLILFTFSEFDTDTGIRKRVGYFDGNNGLFFESDAGTLRAVRRTNLTGSPVDNAVNQSNWNVDKLDGTGVSGVTLDLTKAQIGIIDFEWLGVGRARMGFVVGGVIYYCHEFLNANVLSTVYMSTPNLPVRYEIENDGTGAADDLVQICASVASEGGQQDTGVLQYHSTAGTHVDANVENTLYAVLGVRLKAAYLGCTVNLQQMSMIAETKDDFEWQLLWNPTVAGTFTFSDKTNSCCQVASGATANTVSGGTVTSGGFASSSVLEATVGLQNALTLGSAIDGTVDELVLAVRPLSINADIQAGLLWRELS